MFQGFFIFYFSQNFFQVLRDPCIAFGDNGYVATLVRLKCFKEK
jgi:hypothetical protein